MRGLSKSVRRILIALIPLLAASVAAAGGSAPDPDRIYLKGATLRSSDLSFPDDAVIEESGAARLWIVHFTSEASVRERRLVTGARAEILGYLPRNAYLIRADQDAAQLLSAEPRVNGIGAYRPEWKVHPSLGSTDADNEFLTLSFTSHADLPALAEAIRDAGARVLSSSSSPHRSRIWVWAETAPFEALSRLPELIWISETLLIEDRNDNIKWICQSAVLDETPIWDQGLHGEEQIIGHIDSNFELNVCWFEDPEGDPVGPDHRKVVYLGDSPPVSTPSHGTHTAGILIGDKAPITGEEDKRGLAYEARIANSNYAVPLSGFDFYSNLVTHHEHGARVHSNSWGQDGITEYTGLCYDIDRFSWEYEEDLVAFAVTNWTWLQTPENAKNVLAVGATYSSLDFNILYSGGAGPTADGRRKPEIFAPGRSILSAHYNDYCDITSKSGTSMACPAVIAGSALVRQYFTEGWYPTGAAVAEDPLTPSGALLRAVLLNSTAVMEDPLYPEYPNDHTGWGRLLLDEALYFEGESRRLRVEDVRHAEGLEAGETHAYPFELLDSNEPLEVTLVFSDFPGEEGAEYPVVNDLDLIVQGPSGQYLGNVFDTIAGESTGGGEADALNMVERVVLHVPEPGEWEVRVEGTFVPMGPQGYALAINGSLETPVSVPIDEQVQRLIRLQCSPNPFNPSTQLRFHLGETAQVELTIYDTSGRLVRRLLDKRLIAGQHVYEWNGCDDSGVPVSSGVYIARAGANDSDDMEKLVLLK